VSQPHEATPESSQPAGDSPEDQHAVDLGATMVYPAVAPVAPAPVPEEFLEIHVEVLGGPMDGLDSRQKGDAFTIGRVMGCQLVLPQDASVSMHHARIDREGQSFFLSDLDSRNGTYLGDQRLVDRTPIGPGTTFTVGRTQLEFQPR